MTKNCKQCSAQFEITQDDLDFYDSASPVFNWNKYQIPTPTLCPSCRMQRRMSCRNFFNLYQRRCSATWKNIISMYHKDAPFPVYNFKDWRSDKWDWTDYWMDFDFNKSFFEQRYELNKKVPKQNLVVRSNCENSDYCNLCYNCTNCYLVFWSVDNEQCCYGHIVWHSSNCMDCLYVYKSEYCYQCIDAIWSYNVFYWISIENCSDSKFLINPSSTKF